ncbi:hypothetical protein BCR42DRAFT_419230, partial [Absidia repens]
MIHFAFLISFTVLFSEYRESDYASSYKHISCVSQEYQFFHVQSHFPFHFPFCIALTVVVVKVGSVLKQIEVPSFVLESAVMPEKV